MSSMKITEKQVTALNNGLRHGVMSKALDFPNYHNDFLLKRERDAYLFGYNSARDGDYLPIYKKEGHKYKLLVHAIKQGHIEPVKWRVYHNIEYGTFSIESDI